MHKPQSEPEYVSNNSFMTSQVKVPNPFGGDYEDPLETLKAEQKKQEKLEDQSSSTAPTTPTNPTKMLYSEQSLEGIVGIESNPTTPTFHSINTVTSDASKTSFKDNTRNDDEARARRIFGDDQAAQCCGKKVDGKKRDKARCGKLGNSG